MRKRYSLTQINKKLQVWRINFVYVLDRLSIKQKQKIVQQVCFFLWLFYCNFDDLLIQNINMFVNLCIWDIGKWEDWSLTTTKRVLMTYQTTLTIDIPCLNIGVLLFQVGHADQARSCLEQLAFGLSQVDASSKMHAEFVTNLTLLLPESILAAAAWPQEV